MNRPFLVIVFLLVASLGMSAQTPSTSPAPASPSAASGQSADTAQTPVTSGTQKTNVGSGAQTGAGTPAQNTSPNGTGPVTPSGTLKPSVQAPATPATQEGNPTVSDSDLQSQIQNALTKEPTLSADSLQANVTDQNIELSGNVETAREKQTALRIVQSYAANKKVVNHISVGSRSVSSPSQTERPPDHPESPNPATNPEPNKGSRPPL